MYSQEGSGNGQGEQEVTSPSHYIFEQFQNSYQFRILFTNPEKIFELLCPYLKNKDFRKILHMGGSAETISAIHNGEKRWSTIMSCLVSLSDYQWISGGLGFSFISHKPKG